MKFYKYRQQTKDQVQQKYEHLRTTQTTTATARKLQVQKLGNNTLTQQTQHVTAAVKNKVLKIPATNERSSTTKYKMHIRTSNAAPQTAKKIRLATGGHDKLQNQSVDD